VTIRGHQRPSEACWCIRRHSKPHQARSPNEGGNQEILRGTPSPNRRAHLPVHKQRLQLGIRLDAAHKPRLRRLQLGHQVAKRLDKLVADGRKRGLCLLLATATFLFGLGLAQVSYLWGNSAVVSTGGTLLVGVRGCSGCVRLAYWIRVGAPRPLWRESHCSSRGSLRREVIRGHQRSSEVIRGHQRSSEEA
jgi:hypothetical protein